MADVPSFGLHTPVDLFNKLVEERKDLDRSDCLDERHALNAVWTAYHLYDWAFRDAEAKGLLTQ